VSDCPKSCEHQTATDIIWNNGWRADNAEYRPRVFREGGLSGEGEPTPNRAFSEAPFPRIDGALSKLDLMNNMSSINAISVRKIRIVQDILFSPMEGRSRNDGQGKKKKERT
jgi:hypothetical protein